MDLKDNGNSYTDGLIQNNDKDTHDEKVLVLKVTENMANIGIIEFVMYRHESEHIISFDFTNNKKCYISFLPRKISVTNLLKEVKKKLLQTLGSVDDYNGFNFALIDIENQIVEHRYKIFDTFTDTGHNNNNNNHEIDIFKPRFIQDVIKLRNQWIESSITY